MPFSVPRAFIHTPTTNALKEETLGSQLVASGIAGGYAGLLIGAARGWWRSPLLREIVPWGTRGLMLGGTFQRRDINGRVFYGTVYTSACFVWANYVRGKDDPINMAFGGAVAGLAAGASSNYHHVTKFKERLTL
jgi:hypothetical protein